MDKIYQPTRSKDWRWNLFKTFCQTLIFWFFFLGLFPMILHILEKALLFPNFIGKPLWGWLLFGLLGSLGLWSGSIMSLIGKGTPLPLDAARQLVVSGPYRYVRNPMAIAGIGQGVSVGLILGSYLIIVYALIGAFLWHILIRPSEERDLEKRFGIAYRSYKKKVICWLPRFQKWNSNEHK